MKVPPKRKGNLSILNLVAYSPAALNESPSEKEGKLFTVRTTGTTTADPQ